ncbi:MAG: protein kinase [Kofleriaceae bacterium]
MKKPTPFGKYFLLERINVGGMAEVFRAKAFGVEGFERLVAVKRILPNIAEDKEFIRMFIEEAKLSVQLNHANIAQIFDLGVVDGSYYIALEHVHGRDLRGIFERCRGAGEAMPVAQACFMVMKVCEGLDYAHNKRDQTGRELSLVHRDVSPQNVLVSFEGEVKLIDFGIAKAAGKGSKTQAGILKGKFGYMSPEQVRGLPVDRRSDVFSCGIVLYELLTGERLFVGESDFSTLEKVRNVEILPPSTYNRKIPDELERIVLKALAKDVEDRYQNAIDLHDELQAFVYTAGEFYSRKDLAAWMKKTFGREIEEETAKLESYRQLKPPPTPESASRGRQSVPPTPSARRSNQGMGAGTKPPPPPVRASAQMAAVAPRVDPGEPETERRVRTDDSGALAWDEDELETHIYDDDPKKKAAKPAGPTTGQGAAVAVEPAGNGTPDLSTLVSQNSWESGRPIGPHATTINGLEGSTGAATIPDLASGSNKAPAPEYPAARFDAGLAPAPQPRTPDLFAPPSRVSRTVPRNDHKRSIAIIAVSGAAVAAAVVVVVMVMGKGGASSSTPAPVIHAANAEPAAASAPTPQLGVTDQNTGFDLYVSPAGVTVWKLDGQTRTDRLPARIRIAPGEHTVQIDPPPGFMSQSQLVRVEQGKAPKVEIALSPIQGIHGLFETTPPGATVALIIDGKREVLGPSPAKAPLDPRVTYRVAFEKPGYISVNRPVSFTGSLEERIAVSLEKTGSESASRGEPRTRIEPKVEPRAEPKAEPKIEPKGEARSEPKAKPEVKQPDLKPDEPKAKGQGTLWLSSKPPCEIVVDGASSGLSTPTKDLKLSAGKHRITLVNNEFGIKETIVVDIKPDEVEKKFADFSEKLPK